VRVFADSDTAEADVLTLQEDGLRKSPNFTFDGPVVFSGPEDVFTITYTGGAHPVTLHLLGPNKMELSTVKLPKPPASKEGSIRYEVPLGAETKLGGFFFASKTQAGALCIESCGIDTASVGLRKEDTIWRIGKRIKSFSIINHGENGLDAFHIDIDSGPSAPTDFLKVRYTCTEEAVEADYNDPVYFTITGVSETKQKRFHYYVYPGARTIHLYPQSWGFLPDELLITEIPDGVEIKSFSFGKPGRESPDPLPLEAGSVLSYPKDSWRNPDYELFAWSRAPGILIMDTADYTIQSRYFKRLAFFVEKYGFTGRLLPDSALEGRHGWNAHDYRAVDLAFFFQKAAESRFRLHEKEEHLKNILIENGIIREERGAFVPGAGGIISISHSSSAYLREKFLIHECFHGLFFVDEKIHKIGFAQWEKLDGTEKEFWRYFLRWMHYNIEDTYLLVNEYLAYLFQQPVGEADSYFRNHPAFRFALENAPNGAAMVRKTEESTTYFYDLAKRMQEGLYEQTFVTSETILGLVPASQ
jgi:hypothetical protein